MPSERFARLAAALGALAVLAFPPPAASQGQKLTPTMTPLGFLVGHWTSDQAHAETRTIRGTSVIEPVTGGAALLRRDHTDILAADGTVSQSFDQVMLVYPEAGHIHADYIDGDHVIHYVDAVIDAGHSARFLTAPTPGAPAFALTYAQRGADGLSIKFEMRPPGQAAFQTLAEGTASRR